MKHYFNILTQFKKFLLTQQQDKVIRDRKEK